MSPSTSQPKPTDIGHVEFVAPGLDGRTADDLLIVLGGLMLDRGVGDFHARQFAARVPLTVLGELGVAENAIRMALTRQVQRGLLSSSKTGRIVVYEFTEAGVRSAIDAGLRVRADRPFAPTSTVWTLVSFSVPESRRDVRSRLRIALANNGFRTFRDGLWVAFSGDAAARISAGLEPELIEHSQLDVFVATPFLSNGLADFVRREWDVDKVRARHLHFLARWERLEPRRERALPLLTQFAADWVALLDDDPGLPADVVGADWPGERSAMTAARLFTALQTPAGASLKLLVDAGSPHGATPK